jgi:hypothetical protein
VVQVFAPNRADQALNEWMRDGREGHGFDFRDIQDTQIRLPSVKPK